MEKRVLLGLSGGVDSAVAAYILKEQGYDVTCAFMRNWDAYANNDIKGNPTIQNDVCPQEKDYQDAQAVADALGLKLLRVDFIKEYWDYVFATFIEEHKKGRTPNPDILCNKYIKFDAFLKFADDLGFEMIATGHYAQVLHNTNESVMLRGTDDNKDQTYFLCQLSQEALRRTLFPIGNLKKQEVRRIAKEQMLPVAEKKDSTGICFIGERNFRAFLQNYLPSQNGPIVDIRTLHTVGEHIGVMYYTIGQRKGLGIGGSLGPWFVAGKDIEKNILYVCNGNEKDWLYSDSCLVSHINWISSIHPNPTMHCSAKFRYRQKDHFVTVTMIGKDTALVQFDALIEAVTCGQEAVFYLDEKCMGGGVIDDVYIHEVSLSKRITERASNKME